MAIDFPATSGQATDGSYTHTASGITWAWDGTTWKAQGVTGSYVLPTASATVLGGIKVGTGLSINSSTGILTATGGGGGSYTDSDVDTHLNTSTAADGEVLSWNATTSDYDWVAQSGGSGAGTPTITWTLTAPNAPNDYTFSGDGFPTSQTDPTLYLIRGQTYKFVNNTGGHPFRIQSTGAQVGGGTSYDDGVTNQDATGASNQTLTFVVPMDAPDTLYYQCTAHPAMFGTINILTQGAPARRTAIGTTASIANNASDNITIAAAKTYVLHQIETSHAAWITLYTDDNSRTNDANRTELEDPSAGSGVIAEIVTVGPTQQKITPGTIGFNYDVTPSTNVYIKVVNKSGSTNTVQVTLTYLALEI